MFKSVQLVRGSSFRNDLLQNPYFSMIVKISSIANNTCAEKITHDNKQTIRVATNSSMTVANFAAIIRRRFFYKN